MKFFIWCQKVRCQFGVWNRIFVKRKTVCNGWYFVTQGKSIITMKYDWENFIYHWEIPGMMSETGNISLLVLMHNRKPNWRMRIPLPLKRRNVMKSWRRMNYTIVKIHLHATAGYVYRGPWHEAKWTELARHIHISLDSTEELLRLETRLTSMAAPFTLSRTQKSPGDNYEYFRLKQVFHSTDHRTW